ARLRPGAVPVLPRARGEKPIASPAVRARAREAGIDLRRVAGSGPAGRITHEDLDRLFEQGPQAPAAGSALVPDDSVEEIKLVGLRRRIAEKMRVAHERIADMTYVEELDVTDLESLRAKLNEPRSDRPRLTLLPFLMRAIAIAVAEQPRMNAHFDDENGVLRRYGGVHVGIAAQTANGLVVPVVRHVEARDLWSCAAELARVADAAKGGTATREELSGSTITITSLGAMGGIVTTPVINHPEVAIIGVNRIAMRPMWDGASFVPRKAMNLSCSFDHRVVDGWDAAVFVHRLKALLETPAMLFVS
ncbi:MAG TPA: dihydrolipoamide acetyltransferase family protein, partial [Zeimonas sp.]